MISQLFSLELCYSLFHGFMQPSAVSSWCPALYVRCSVHFTVCIWNQIQHLFKWASIIPKYIIGTLHDIQQWILYALSSSPRWPPSSLALPVILNLLPPHDPPAYEDSINSYSQFKVQEHFFFSFSKSYCCRFYVTWANLKSDEGTK